MDEDLYDEFGTYIGPDMGSSEDEEELDAGAEEGFEEQFGGGGDDEARPMDAEPEAGAGAIVLHEDKQYYPDASDVFPGAQVLVEEEDAQPISQPIIEPVRTRNFSVLETEAVDTKYKSEFLVSLLDFPAMVRNVAVAGNLSSGKTALLDVLIEATHSEPWAPHQERRYTDTRLDEQARGLSIKSCPVSLLLPSTRGKSYVLNVIDCPGHVCFSDENSAAFRAVDGVVVVVDAAEGVMLQTRRVIKEAVRQEIAVTLCISKVDRLILELKLPPADAYFKLLHTIDECNVALAEAAPAGRTATRLSPAQGNVLFASGTHGWTFSLKSFAQALYPDVPELAARLWGNRFLDPATRKFVKRAPASGAPRTFVQFVLEPLYKVYSQAVGEDFRTLEGTLRELGVSLRREELHLDSRPLLRLIMRQLLGSPSGLVDMCVQHVKTPLAAASAKVDALYTGPLDSPVADAMRRCDPNGAFVADVVKLYASPDGTKFSALARVYSGCASVGDEVRVLGPRFVPGEDEEDVVVCVVEAVSVPQARYTIDISRAPCGTFVLLDGVSDSIAKAATITSSDAVHVFRPLSFDTVATVKLSVEPLNPSELPKLMEGLRRVKKTYPLVRTVVEESGEHVLLATGELSMDCAMYDLREVFGNLEVKVADPATTFRETVSEVSKIQCYADSPNGRNRLSMIAEPLDQGLAEDIDAGNVSMAWDRRTLGRFFQTKYDWDLLAARSVWAFGPDAQGPNVLVNDTLASETDAEVLEEARGAIAHGFTWAAREGPLCGEPMRACKVKLLDAALAPDRADRGRSHLIPTARRTTYSAFLTAAPRLMEPTVEVEIVCPADCVAGLSQVLSRRRGHMVRDVAIAGTPLFRCQAFVPVIESFGFETDVRSFTQGQAFCQQVFSHWSVVPGDPLDKSVVLHPLEPAPMQALAREFMLKTRRRKGLSDTVSISQYFTDPRVLEQAAVDEELSGLL